MLVRECISCIVFYVRDPRANIESIVGRVVDPALSGGQVNRLSKAAPEVVVSNAGVRAEFGLSGDRGEHQASAECRCC